MDQPFTIDSITASVVQGALENIAVEMGYKLMRMSYSSIIRESEDFGAALVDAEGRGLAESAQSTPLQSGPIPGYIRGILQALRERGDAVRPGDVIMHNDAYGGASHGPDVGFAVPVFRDGRLVAFAAPERVDAVLQHLLGLALALGHRAARALDVRARAGMVPVEKQRTRPDVDRLLILRREIVIEADEEELLDLRVAIDGGHGIVRGRHVAA